MHDAPGQALSSQFHACIMKDHLIVGRVVVVVVRCRDNKSIIVHIVSKPSLLRPWVIIT